jgi:3D (Asp-Asp-Asp) domain-containing protein
MGYQKLQAGNAVAADTIFSDTEDTLNLKSVITLTSNALTAGTTGVTLIAATATFITDGVTAGDLVVNTSATPQVSRVVSVDSETQITVQTTGLFASGNTIQIWTQSKEPAVLYVGVGGNVKVRTMGGDDVTFTGLVTGQFVPVQCVRVFATGTTATDIVALW